MIDFTLPEVKPEEENESFGRFVIAPLEPGFGITVGNALRRVLLGALPGAAVTAIRIDGILHEFSTVPEMKEDVIEFILNVKEIRIRPITGRPGTMRLEVAREGPIYAGDIEPSPDFEIANPELYLATMNSDKFKLSVEFQVEIGRGYRPATYESNLPIGVIPVDAVFSPIRRVSFNVEKMRIGQRSDYEKLILEIQTDRTITPAGALREASKILVRHFEHIAGFGVPEAEKRAELVATPAKEEDKNLIPLEQIGLSTRTYNALRRAKIFTVGDFLSKSKEELLKLRNFGIKSWEEVWSKLEAMGIAERPAEEVPAAPAEEVAEERAEEVEEAKAEEEEELKLEELKEKLKRKFRLKE